MATPPSNAIPQNYEDYIRQHAERLRGPAATQPVYAPASGLPTAPAIPSFPSVVSQNDDNGAKPLSEEQLDDLKNQYEAQHLPTILGRMQHPTKLKVDADKAAFQSKYDQFKAAYLKAHGITDPNAPGAPGQHGAIHDFFVGAVDPIITGAIDTGRLVGGGVAALGDAGANLVEHALGNKGYQANLADSYFKLYDQGLGLKNVEDTTRAVAAQAHERHPLAAGTGEVGGVLASLALPGGKARAVDEASLAAAGRAPRVAQKVSQWVTDYLVGHPGKTAKVAEKLAPHLRSTLPAAAKIAVPQAARDVSSAQSQGATTAEQEKLLAASLGGNLALGTLLPGEGATALKRLGINAAAGGGGAVGLQALEHAAAPDQVGGPTLKGSLQQAAINLVLGELAHGAGKLGKTARAKAKAKAVPPEATAAQAARAAYDAAGGAPDMYNVNPDNVPINAFTTPEAEARFNETQAKAEQAARDAWVAAGQKAEDFDTHRAGEPQTQEPTTSAAQTQEPTTSAAQTQEPTTSAAPGAGLAPGAHAGSLSEVANMATQATLVPEVMSAVETRVKTAPDPATELVAQSAVLAEDAVGETNWAQMTAGQRLDATEQAAVILADKLGTQGVPEALQKLRTPETPPEPQAQETADSPAPEAPPAPQRADAETPSAEVPGQESVTPQAKREVAQAALDGGSTTVPTETLPPEAGNRTRAQAAQAGTPAENAAEVARHDELDAAIKRPQKNGGAGKRMTKATLAKMTLDEKEKLIADAQAQRRRTPLSKKAPAPEAAQPPAAEAKTAQPEIPSSESQSANPEKAPNESQSANPETPSSESQRPSQEEPKSDIETWLADKDLLDPDEVRDAVALSREGDKTDLLAVAKRLKAEGAIDAEQATQLRKLGRERPLEVERDTEATRKAQEQVQAAVKGETEALVRDNTAEPTTEKGRQAKATIDRAEELARESRGLKSDKAKARQLIARLRKELTHPVQQKGVDFLEWVLDKNPSLLRAVGAVETVPAHSLGEKVGGRFNAVTRILTIVNNPTASGVTAVHELLHAAEGILPPDIRAAIRRQWADATIKAADSAPPEYANVYDFLRRAREARDSRTREAALALAKEEYFALLGKTKVTSRNAESLKNLYSHINPSEYWAVHATDMIHGGYLHKSILARLKDWLRGFTAQLKALYGGNPNKTAIIDGVRHVFTSTEAAPVSSSLRLEFIRNADSKERATALYPEGVEAPLHEVVIDTPQETLAKDNPRTKLDNFIEFAANNAVSFKRVAQTLYSKGIKVPDSLNPYLAFVRLTGQREHNVSVDVFDKVEPIKNWVIANYHRFTPNGSIVEAVDKIGLFFQVHHVLTERIPAEYAQKVPLDNGMEIRRQLLLKDVSDLKLLPKAARAKLDALVKQHASMPMDAWAMQAKGDMYEALVRQRDKLANEGLHPKSLSDLNELVQDMNGRRDHRLVEAGKLAKDDPWRAFYGYDWYVPLQDLQHDGVGDFGRDSGVTPGDLIAMTKDPKTKSPYITNLGQLKTQEGRASWAANPLLRSIVNLRNAGASAADHGFTKTLLQLIPHTARELRAKAKGLEGAAKKRFTEDEFSKAKIRVFKGVPRGGFTEVATGKHFDTLPAKATTLVHNDGRTHYTMDFPHDSELLHGLQAINDNWNFVEGVPILKQTIEGINQWVSKVVKPFGLGPQSKLVTRATQTIAKGYTVFNPVWTLAVQLPRSLGEKPIMLAIKEGGSVVDGARLAGRAYADILRGAFGGGGDMALLMQHKLGELRARGKENPNSWAAWWLRMNEAGGGAAFTQGLTTHESTNILAQGVRKSEYGAIRKFGSNYNRLAMGWSDALENLSSVGIFKSLVEAGMDERAAAARTKDLINFQQTGTAGRAINGYKAYFRITMTVNETMFRAFEHPAGRREVSVLGHKFHTALDWGKIAKWGAVMSSYAAMKYALDRELAGKDKNGKSVLAKIASVNPYDLVQKSFLPTGGDHPLTISVGLGFPQILTAAGTLAAAKGYGDITGEQAANALVETFQRNVSVVDPVGTSEDAGILPRMYAYLMGAPLPTILQPTTGLALNRSSFGKQIHTGYPDLSKFHADQGKKNTPEFWKKTAQEIQSATGVDMYPETLPFIIRNYGGSAITDMVRIAIGQKQRTSQGLTDNTLGRLSRLPDYAGDYYYSHQLYDTLDELNKTAQQYNAVQTRAGRKGSTEYQAAGQQWLAHNPKAAKRLVALKTLKQYKRKYANELKALKASKDSPERKVYARKRLDSQLRQAVDAAKATLE